MTHINTDALNTRLSNLLSSAVSTTKLPMAQAVVTDANGIIGEAHVGPRAIGDSKAADMDTTFLIASCTKAITATGALQLVEQGVLDLDAPARNYVPDMDKLVVLEGWSASGEPITRAPKTPITLRHLLTHTSGLSYEFWNEDVARYIEHEGIPSLETLDRKCLFTPLIAEPGTRWEYSISLDWTGVIMSEVTGKTVEEVLQANVFQPLGMNSTSLKLTEDIQNRMAMVHLRNDDGVLEATDIVNEQNGGFEEAGAAIYCTLHDFSKFMRMILNRGAAGDKRILSDASIDLMTKNAIGDIPVRVMPSLNKVVSNDAEFFPGLAKGWSLGFMVNHEDAPTGRPAGSLGWGGLFNTYYWIDPKNGLGGVFTSQLLPFADETAMETFYAVERAVYESL